MQDNFLEQIASNLHGIEEELMELNSSKNTPMPWRLQIAVQILCVDHNTKNGLMAYSDYLDMADRLIREHSKQHP